MEVVPEIRVEGNAAFKSSKRKMEKSRFLARLLIRSLNRTSPHKDGGHGEDSFTSRELIHGLGRDYKKFLEPLYRFTAENRGYSSTGHSTKMYKLRSSVRKRVRSALRSYDGPERVVDENGSPIFTRRWPQNGNQCKKSEIKVPALLPIDLDTLNETIGTLEEVERKERRSGYAQPLVTKHIDQLCDIRRWVRATGGIPNFYKEEATGRLGRLGQFHIIGTSNIQRMLLFRGTGWCDFDFRNCHYSIFRSLCSYHGFPTPRIDEYLEDHRDQLADLLWSTKEIPHEATKATFISLLYGGRLTVYSPTTTEALTRQVTFVLSQEPWCRELAAEIRQGRDLILGEFRRVRKHTKNVTTNVVGKETTAREMGSRLSHVLFGYERWCLETVCRGFDDTKCLVYDGWMSPDRDVTDLENRILDRSVAELGFPIALNIKKKEIPDSVKEIIAVT